MATVFEWWLTRQAEAEVEAIADHLAERNPAMIEPFLRAVAATCEQIVGAPFAYPVVEWPSSITPTLSVRRRPLVRPFEVYLVFYSLGDTTIDVLHVVHGARDIQRLLDRS